MKIPDGWSRTRLKYTVEAPVNGVWGNESSGSDDDVLCVRVADFHPITGGLREVIPTLRSVEPNLLGGRLLRRGDLLLEKSGGGDLQPVGRAVLVDQDLDTRAVCSNFVARMRPMPGYDPTYLYFLHRALYRAGLTRPSIKQTTGIQNLDGDSYLSQHVVLPEFAHQTVLGSELKAAVAEIELERERTSAVVRLLREIRDARLDALVESGDAPRLRVTYVLRGIEQGWSPECDSTLAEPDEWGVLKVGAVNYQRFRDEQHKALPETLMPRPHLEVRVDDVLMSRANTRELVGSVAYVAKTRPKLMLCDKLYRLLPDTQMILPEYLSLALSRSSVREQLEPAATGASSSMQNISQEIVRSLVIPVPSRDVQRERLEQAHEIVAACDAACGAADRLDAALVERRDSLIRTTVSGGAGLVAVSPLPLEAAG